MAWADQINLSELKVAVAPAGGPIAVMRDDKKFTPVQSSGKPNIFLFSSSGELKNSIKVSIHTQHVVKCNSQLISV